MGEGIEWNQNQEIGPVIEVSLDGFVNATAMLQGGVYALVHHGVVVYVGKAKVMLGRVYTHRVQWGKRSAKAIGRKPLKGILFDSVWVRPCSLDQIDELEHRMINLYKPRYNDRLLNGIPVDIAHLVAEITGLQPTTIAPTPVTIRRRV